MTTYPLTQVARAFVHLHDKYPMTPLVQALAQELVDTHRSGNLDGLVNEIGRYLLMMRRILFAEVISARPLTAQTLAQLRDALHEHTGAQKVRLETRLDPSIVGGCIVRMPGFELDASVSGILKHLITI